VIVWLMLIKSVASHSPVGKWLSSVFRKGKG
jgi:hypothetical protein